MKCLSVCLVALLLLGCERRKGTGTLAQARSGFKTHLTQSLRDGTPAPRPPGNSLLIVRYPAPTGQLIAYLTPDRSGGAKRPAIIWITGGDCNTIGDVWSWSPRENDQTASIYREAGIVMMYPSLRGGNDTFTVQEKFYGEVDDVVAAADFLATQPYVDPQRIYLGGHSTGGTLVLLTCEYSQRFRAVFSLAVADVTDYGDGVPLPFDVHNRQEVDLRAPIMWVDSIKTPTFLFEGDHQSNIGALNQLAKAARQNPFVRTFPVGGATHFSVLWPVNRLIAEKIMHDTGAQPNIAFTASEIANAFARREN